jgi:MFS family permease
VLALHRRTFRSLRRHRNYRLYRRLVIATQALSMALSAALAALALTGAATLPLVYALALLGGTALVFDAPGRHALTFRLVGPDELPNAVALNSSLFNASRVVGPALAGLVIAILGVGACFVLNAASFVAVLAALALIRPHELHPVEQDTSSASLLAGIREGLAFALRARELRLVLAVVAVVSTVGFNFHVILPLLASDTLGAGPETFGLLSAAFGLGALAGGLASAALGRASWKALLGGTAGFSLALLALAPATRVWLCALLLFVVGFCFTLWTTNASAIVQLRAPGHLRARMVSLFLFAFAGLAPAGGLVAGLLVDLGGTELAFGAAGLVGLATAGLATRARRAAPHAAGSLAS